MWGSQLMRDLGRKCIAQRPESRQAGGEDQTLSSGVPAVSLLPWRPKAEFCISWICSDSQQNPPGTTSRDWYSSSPRVSRSPAICRCTSVIAYFIPIEWELQNHIPPGTIRKAWILGGENGPWMKLMRGEITTEDFLQEFGSLCSEIVSDKHTRIYIFFLPNGWMP